MDLAELIENSQLTRLFDRPIPGELTEQCRTLQVDAGHVFYRAGDEADFVYVIASGKVAIFALGEDGEELVLAAKSRNEYFGEDSLFRLAAPRRKANARADAQTACIAVPISALRTAFAFKPEVQNLISQGSKDAFFRDLEEGFKAIRLPKIDPTMVQGARRRYIDREVIYFEGDEPDYAYLVLSGVVDLRSEELDEKDKILLTVQEGELFGEFALLNEEPRRTMAVACGDVELMLVDKASVSRLHRTNPRFRNLVSALKRTYDIPRVGRVRRYAGSFMGMPAVCNRVDVSAERTVVTYQLEGSDIFCISVEGAEHYDCFFHAKGMNEQREIWIKGGVLIGAMNYGYWDDNSALAQMIFHGTSISGESIEHFIATGSLLETGMLKNMGDILCQCMQVSYRQVGALISAGNSSVEQIIKYTGAASVCGACKINIQEMLGANVWKLSRLSRVVRHNDGIWSFRFTPLDRDDRPSVVPGQHVVLRLQIDGAWVERPYTLTSHPEDGFYELTIKREGKGLLSNWLFENAREGMIAYLSDPVGDYTFDMPLKRPTLLLAGGIGITPAIALAKCLGKDGDKPFSVDYSFRKESDAICRALFDRAMQESPLFQVEFRQTSTQGRLGSEELRERLRQFDDAHIYICGPEQFNRQLERILREELNVPAERIFIEEFSHVGGPSRSTA